VTNYKNEDELQNKFHLSMEMSKRLYEKLNGLKKVKLYKMKTQGPSNAEIFLINQIKAQDQKIQNLEARISSSNVINSNEYLKNMKSELEFFNKELTDYSERYKQARAKFIDLESSTKNDSKISTKNFNDFLFNKMSDVIYSEEIYLKNSLRKKFHFKMNSEYVTNMKNNIDNLKLEIERKKRNILQIERNASTLLWEDKELKSNLFKILSALNSVQLYDNRISQIADKYKFEPLQKNSCQSQEKPVSSSIEIMNSFIRRFI